MPVRKRKHIRHEVKVMVWDKSDGRCWYCGRMLEWGDTSYSKRPVIDHIHPWSEGGSNDLENLAYACDRCNIEKRIQSVKDYRAEILQDQVDWLRHAIDSFVNAHWYREGEVERQIVHWLSCAVKGLEAVPRRFYGECLGQPWTDYVI